MADRKKTTSSSSYTVPAIPVVQKLYKTTGLFLTANRPITSYSQKREKDSSIVYQTGNDGSYSPCEHKVTSYSPNGENDPYPQLGTPSNPALTGNIILSECTGLTRHAIGEFRGYLNTAVGAFGTTEPDINWTELSAQAFQAMRPSMNGNFSLINFLLELKDFKHQAKLIMASLASRQKFVENLLNAKGIWTLAMGSSLSGTPLKRWSQRYLAVEFGYKPFVNDVLNLLARLTDFHKKFNELVKRAGTPQSRHWSSGLLPGTQASGSIYRQADVGPPGGSVGFFTPYARMRIRIGEDSGIVYHASMRFKYTMPSDALSAAGQVKGLLDTLGIRPNPAIVWNAIPYTFLIDWVINVGKILDRMSVDNLNFPVEIMEFCHSAKRQKSATMTCQLNGMNLGVEYFGPEATLITVTKSTYRRSVGMPSLYGTLLTSGLSPSQYLLSGALLGSRT
jgi:hypothetical protein